MTLRSVVWMSVLLVSVLLAGVPGEGRAQDASTTDFEPHGEVRGYVFGDYFYKAAGDTASWGNSQYADTEEGMHGGELRRLYLGYDYFITPDVSTRVLLEANDGTTFANGSYGVRVKLGYLSWAQPLGVPVTVNVGLVPTPVFTFPQKTWGYRSIEKEVLDARGFGSSADQGVLLEGSTGSQGGYRLMVANNSGTKPDTDPHVGVYGSVFQRVLGDRLSLEVMGSHLPQRGDRARTIGRLFAGYEVGAATFGVEMAGIYEQAPAERGAIPGTEITRVLVSTFSSIALRRTGPAVKAFARYDFFDPDLGFETGRGYTSPDPFYTEHLVLLGLDVAPHPRVHVIPNLWINAYRARGNASDRPPDVVPRVTFYFIYN